uniref:Polysaccharide biosynthesis domain-containing protein n=1 Tax=Phasianus colchicus TaxID=9054 RepID=A0A669QVU2_PHACC
MLWAMRASQHAEVYFNLISSVDPKFLTLTKVDEQIYGEFRKAFGGLRVDVLDPEELKSEPAKEKWRPFCLRFEGVVEDFNYGTLLRLDCRGGYSPENTIFGTENTACASSHPWGCWVPSPPLSPNFIRGLSWVPGSPIFIHGALGTSAPHPLSMLGSRIPHHYLRLPPILYPCHQSGVTVPHPLSMGSIVYQCPSSFIHGPS